MIAQKGQQRLRQWMSDPRVRMGLTAAGYGLAGFFLSAAGLLGRAMPLAMGLTCALTGWRALVTALGSILGCWVFWGSGGYQGMLWAVGGCLAALFLGKRRESRESVALIPAVAAFWVSASGLVFQVFFRDDTPVPIYFLRIAAAAGGAGLCLWLRRLELPRPQKGPVGLAQVRLEIMAGVLTQTQQLLLETPETPIDEEAIFFRARERACGSCPQRKTCQESAKLTVALLHIPLSDASHIPCRKPNRLLTELRRSQEQLRSLKADRDRQREYRQAVVQQYRFLGDFLRQIADQLPKKGKTVNIFYRVETQIASYSKENANGDKCQCFDGTGGKYYIALCDGMGTGIGAAQEGQTAMTMLKKMLTAGFPAQYALGSINSLCCLRFRAGAVTVDLAEIDLETGKVCIYKWGAAPSWVLRSTGAEKIGTAGPPPGLSVGKTRETVDKLSLRRGEILVLMSDGMDGEGALLACRTELGEPLGETAAKLLELGCREESDDATVAAIRLLPTAT